MMAGKYLVSQEQIKEHLANTNRPINYEFMNRDLMLYKTFKLWSNTDFNNRAKWLGGVRLC